MNCRAMDKYPNIICTYREKRASVIINQHDRVRAHNMAMGVDVARLYVVRMALSMCT